MESPIKSKREAISYGRFSTAAQGAEGKDSTRRQKESFDRVCERHKDKCTPSTRYDFGAFFGKGESGFSAKHLADGGSLAALITAMESGEINPHKTVIVIEAFDRLGRMEPDLATALLSRLVRSGCAVAVDRPDCWIGSPADLNGPNWFLVQAMLVLAHQESKQKSDRGKSNWAGKRTRATEKPLTKMLPFWCKISHGKIVEIPEKSDTIRRIFTMTVEDGLGRRVIGGIFNREHVPGIGKKTAWQSAYIRSILTDRRVIGEYQPHVKVDGKRIPHGEPIRGYFPVVVPLDLWYRAQNCLAERGGKKAGGRTSANVNLFTGLLKDADTGDGYHTINKGHYRYLASASCVEGKKDFIGVAAPEFEQAFLSYLCELNSADLTDKKNNGSAIADKIEAGRGELREVEESISQMKARLARKYSDGVADALDSADEKRKALVAALEELEGQRASSGDNHFEEAKSLMLLVREKGEDAEFRERLKAKMGQIIRKVWVRITSNGGFHRRIYCQICFRQGGYRMMQIDMNRKGRGGRRLAVTVCNLPIKPGNHPLNLAALDNLASWEIPAPEPLK